MLTREQTTKAIEELKANEWMALGGLSPEAREFVDKNYDKYKWEFRHRDKWINSTARTAHYLDTVYRLDPSYQLPDEVPEETEYLEFATYWKEYGRHTHLSFDINNYDVFAKYAPEQFENYQLEGFKFAGNPKLHNHYFGYKNPSNNYIHYHQPILKYTKVFASKVVYRKVG